MFRLFFFTECVTIPGRRFYSRRHFLFCLSFFLQFASLYFIILLPLSVVERLPRCGQGACLIGKDVKKKRKLAMNVVLAWKCLRISSGSKEKKKKKKLFTYAGNIIPSYCLWYSVLTFEQNDKKYFQFFFSFLSMSENCLQTFRLFLALVLAN